MRTLVLIAAVVTGLAVPEWLSAGARQVLACIGVACCAVAMLMEWSGRTDLGLRAVFGRLLLSAGDRLAPEPPAPERPAEIEAFREPTEDDR